MAPSADAELPAAQLSHTDAPDNAANEPAGQLRQLDDKYAPDDAKKVPAIQAAQLDRPALAAYEPAKQLLHAIAPVDPMNVPWPQLVHTLAAALE